MKPTQIESTTESTAKSFGILTALLLICVGGGAAIGILTAGNLDSWYDTLNKPSWTPPNWVFGPAWTVLYTLMAVAMWWVWRSGTRSGQSTRAAALCFAVQLLLNFLWTPVFFGGHQLGWGLLIILLLIAAVAITIVAFQQHSRLASWLLIPYLCWVIYATTLNGGFWWLNR